MLQYVLFDLDGTLTDSRSGITQSWAHALRSLGREPPTLQALEQHIGPPTREIARVLLDSHDDELVERCVAHYRERYATVGLFENAVYPGIDALLPELSADGYTLLICTSKPAVYAKRIAEHYGFSRWMHAIYGCELDGTRAEKTELLRYILEQERIAPQSSVMIGDRMHDVRAARQAGVQAIGVLYGFGSRDELEAAGATVLCASAAELRGAIHSFG